MNLRLWNTGQSFLGSGLCLPDTLHQCTEYSGCDGGSSASDATGGFGGGGNSRAKIQEFRGAISSMSQVPGMWGSLTTCFGLLGLFWRNWRSEAIGGVGSAGVV